MDRNHHIFSHAFHFRSMLQAWLLATALLFCGCSQEKAKAETEPPARERIIAVASSSVGQREATGNNDGAFVDEVLATCGLRGKRLAWCAAWNRWVYDTAGFSTIGPRSAWSPDWVANPTWENKSHMGKGYLPLPADAFGIWFASKGRIAHTGLIESWKPPFALTIEGNTNSGGSRDGDGVYRRRRQINQIHSTKNWIDSL